MPAKTNKELKSENSELTLRFNNLKQNFDKLSSEHKILQTKLLLEQEKVDQKRNNCDESIGKEVDLKKHKNRQKSTNVVFKCEKCGKEFSEEWKLRAHVKTHGNYKCEKCDKTFVNLDIKKKHVLISHENMKLFCHFYNNQKTCPFDDKCIFLHEDSKFCRFDLMCERDLCMYKHRKKDEPEKNEAHNCYAEENDVIDIMSDFDENEQEVENDEHDEAVNKTFFNPTQIEVPSCELMFKCENCEYRASRKSEVNSHKTACHNWCSLCFSTFNSKEKLKDHINKNHIE